MKKKSLAALLSGFLTVCLTGVGFASWIIVQGDTETVSGQVNVEDIHGESIELACAWAGEKDTLSFGKNNPTTAPTYGWLQNNDGEGETLTLELNVTVTNPQLVSKKNGVTFSIAPNAEGKTNYEAAISAGYITAVTAVEKEGSTSYKKFATETDTATFTIVVSAKWGSYFGSKNPFEYYNTYASSASLRASTTEEQGLGKIDADGNGTITYAEDANYSLGQLYTKLSNVSFTLTITAEG